MNAINAKFFRLRDVHIICGNMHEEKPDDGIIAFDPAELHQAMAVLRANPFLHSVGIKTLECMTCDTYSGRIVSESIQVVRQGAIEWVGRNYFSDEYFSIYLKENFLMDATYVNRELQVPEVSIIIDEKGDFRLSLTDIEDNLSDKLEKLLDVNVSNNGLFRVSFLNELISMSNLKDSGKQVTSENEGSYFMFDGKKYESHFNGHFGSKMEFNALN